MGMVSKKTAKTLARAVAVLLVLCLVWYVIGRLTSGRRALSIRDLGEGAPAEQLADGAQLRIGTYNVAHGRGLAFSTFAGGEPAVRVARLREIGRLLKDARLDIVVLNEVDFRAPWSGHLNQAEFVAREAGLPHLLEQRNFEVCLPFYRASLGNAVLSRFPITGALPVAYPTYSTWENVLAGKKSGAVCTIELPEGRTIRLMPVHLEYRSESVCVESARLIEDVRRESDLPLVCAGDFNSTPVDFPHAHTDKDGQSAVSLLLDGGGFHSTPKGPPGPRDFTFRATEPDRVIDWILVPPTWRITSRRVPAVMHSDHLPVIMTVETEHD